MAERADRAWRAVAISMGAGALYDLAFAVAILVFAPRTAALLRLPLPDEMTYLRLNGVFLVMLAAMYALAARRPAGCQGIVAVAAAGRALGFVVLAGAWAGGGPRAFLVLALGDLAFAVAHALLLLRARRS